MPSLEPAIAARPAVIPIGFAHADGWFGIHSVNNAASMARVFSKVPPPTKEAEQHMAARIARGTSRVSGPGTASIDDLAEQMALYSLPPEQFHRLVWRSDGPGIMVCLGVEVFPGGEGACDCIFGRVGRSFLEGMSACAEDVTRRWRASAPAVPQRNLQLPKQLNPLFVPHAAQPEVAVSVTQAPLAASRRQRRRRSSASGRRASESESMVADAASAVPPVPPTDMMHDDSEEPVRLRVAPLVTAVAATATVFMGTTCTSFSAPLTPECATFCEVLALHVHECLSLYVLVRSIVIKACMPNSFAPVLSPVSLLFYSSIGGESTQERAAGRCGRRRFCEEDRRSYPASCGVHGSRLAGCPASE